MPFVNLDQVVWNIVNSILGLKVNRRINFAVIKKVFSLSADSKLIGKQYKQKTSLKSCKNEIKILTNPELA